MPLLVALFDVVGIWGGYLVGVDLLGVSAGSYWSSIESAVDWKDVYGGILKSISFGADHHVGLLLQRLLHEDERGRSGHCDDRSRCAFVRADFGMGLFFDISAAVVRMLKMAPNFVLGHLSASTYPFGTPRTSKFPAALFREMARLRQAPAWQALGSDG